MTKKAKNLIKGTLLIVFGIVISLDIVFHLTDGRIIEFIANHLIPLVFIIPGVLYLIPTKEKKK